MHAYDTVFYHEFCGSSTLVDSILLLRTSLIPHTKASHRYALGLLMISQRLLFRYTVMMIINEHILAAYLP